MDRAYIIGLPPRIDSAFLPTEKLSEQCGLNTGNLVYAYAIAGHLPDAKRTMDMGAPVEHMNRAGRIGVIQGANQLGTHFVAGRQAERFARLDTNLVILGLGAQSELDLAIPELAPNTLDWVRAIADQAPAAVPNIGVRGKFTADVLDHYGFGDRTEVLGCPSLFINPNPNLGREIAGRLHEPRRVAVIAGHESWPSLAKIEASLARLVTETNGTYVGQHGLRMMRLTRGEAGAFDDGDLTRCRNYICPDLQPEAFIRWTRTHGNVFFDVSTWLEHMRRFDFAIGARIHGTIIALQAGIPALCIAHDSRTLELCQTMGVPHVRPKEIPDGVRQDELLSLLDFDGDAFDANRRKLAKRYVAFLKGNLLRPVQWLVDIADAA